MKNYYQHFFLYLINKWNSQQKKSDPNINVFFYLMVFINCLREKSSSQPVEMLFLMRSLSNPFKLKYHPLSCENLMLFPFDTYPTCWLLWVMWSIIFLWMSLKILGLLLSTNYSLLYSPNGIPRKVRIKCYSTNNFITHLFVIIRSLLLPFSHDR